MKVARTCHFIRATLLLSIWLTLLSFYNFAQDDLALPDGVTFDQVNAIAAKMFCPECENIPLDKCSTVVCIQWKNEIALRLAQGQSETEIIEYFVTSFGNRVVDVPQEPLLRALSLLGPWILAGIMGFIGLMTLLRLRATRNTGDEFSDEDNSALYDDYRARLERDLNA